jgi:glyoxylase-like metal-dependent hydrolase (beta-lactamase superfamily II)/DNA-binding beta-propeller fold protein YncE
MCIPALLIALTLQPDSTTADSIGARDAIEGYFSAHALGDGRYITQHFASDAAIQFVERGVRTTWTRDAFASRFTGGPASDEYVRVRSVQRLDVSGTAASAVLTLDYPQVQFTDHVSLLQIGGRWQIVSKVFSADHRNADEASRRTYIDEWSKPFAPRKVIGNIYYVGSNLISVFLIATPAGDILLDTGDTNMLPQVMANIRRLGFQPRDVKLLLNSHGHIDHAGAFAEFRRRTGATIAVSRAEAVLMEHGGTGDYASADDLSYEPVTPDRLLDDGDVVALGGVTMTAHLTPGHTKGCTTWSMRVEDHGKPYDVIFICGLVISPFKLTNNTRYPNVVADERASLAKLRAMHADVMLAAHGFWFDLEGKAARQKPGAPNPFVDPGELPRHITAMQADLDSALAAQERQRSTLLVMNKGDRTLTLADPESGQQLAAIPIPGVTGHEVAVSPDGRTAWVPIYGNAGVGAPGTDGQTIVAIDLAARQVAGTITLPSPRRPHVALFGPRDGRLYVTTELTRSITVIDPATRTIVDSIPTGAPESHMFVISSDGNRAYTANVSTGTVSAIDLRARRVRSLIPVSTSVQRIAISPDDRWVFTADQTRPRIAVIDTRTNAVASWIPLPALGYGLTVTHDGRHLLVAEPAARSVAIISVASRSIERSVSVPAEPQESVVSADDRTVYVSCDESKSVAAIDLASGRIVRTIAAGAGADGLALVPSP